MRDIIELHTRKSRGELDEYLKHQVITEAQKIMDVYKVSGVARSSGAELFAKNIIKLFSAPTVAAVPTAGESPTGIALENELRRKFLINIGTAYTDVTILRTDKEGCAPQPFVAAEAAGITEDARAIFTKSLTYSGELMQAALEAYVFSKLPNKTIEKLCKMTSTAKLDFSEAPGAVIFDTHEVEVEGEADEEWVAVDAQGLETRADSTRLFHAFLTILQTFPLSCDPAATDEAKRAWEERMRTWNTAADLFDAVVSQYLETHAESLGDKSRYSQKGLDAITARETPPPEIKFLSVVSPIISHPFYKSSIAAAKSTLALRIAEATNSVVTGAARSRGIDSPTIGRAASATALHTAAQFMGAEIPELDETQATQARAELAATAGTAMVNSLVSLVSFFGRCCTPPAPTTPPTSPLAVTISAPQDASLTPTLTPR